jgi:hypothetical protein
MLIRILLSQYSARKAATKAHKVADAKGWTPEQIMNLPNSNLSRYYCTYTRRISTNLSKVIGYHIPITSHSQPNFFVVLLVIEG